MGLWNDIKGSFNRGSSLTKLIYINLGVFIAISFAAIAGFLFTNPLIDENTVRFLAVPASLPGLAMRPWTLITYMFLHKDIWHILFNMLWLYWFGTIFLQMLDQRKLVSVYLTGGICGAALYILSFNIFPAFAGIVSESVAIGASASVMAVVVAIAAYTPDYPINLLLLGRVKIKYMALAILVLTSFMDFQVNSGGKLAHIGGAIFGYVYAMKLRQGSDLGKWTNAVIDWCATLLKPRKKMKVTYRRPPANDHEYNKVKADRQAEINAILDKISKGGYDSLTREEKDILFRESQSRH
ncbi:MAG: rhomboid family intramembrane serine protease [Bacteroidales bacterium]|jgi:membrane associated rhomboid family serine protease|nr:rhomboid family intramembrane serine protease [Bacteroidales bacterium]